MSDFAGTQYYASTQHYVGLVHYPVKDKNAALVTTSITNMDVHDISRSCKTFGVKQYFLISPLQKQKELIDRILGYWSRDSASEYNPDRANALSQTSVIHSISSCIDAIESKEGRLPYVVATGANFQSEKITSIKYVLKQCEIDNRPLFLLFGTGWGLADEALNLCDFKFPPILGSSPDGYNHLSVRSAVAIYLEKVATLRCLLQKR